MSTTIGRCSLVGDPYNMSISGTQVSFSIDIEPTTVGTTDQVKAQCQQLSGLVENRDEPVVPFTWSEDPNLNGFYKDLDVSIPWAALELTTGWAQGAQITMERVGGYANPWFEVTTQAVLRTNVHGLTVPAARSVATCADATETDWGSLASYTFGSLLVDDGSGTGSGVVDYGANAVPLDAASFRFASAPSSFYTGACVVEILYGSTWYKVMGRNIPRVKVWRISNGYVRLTSANGATSGKFETWDYVNDVWVGQNVKHYSSGTHTGIGIGTGSTQATVTILRNSPESVTVKCSGYLSGTSGHTWSISYTVARAQQFVECAWNATTASNIGLAFTSATVMYTSAQVVAQSSLFSSVGYLIFTTPVAHTDDLVNGSMYNTTATTSGQFAIAVSQSASTGLNARSTVDPYYGATSWRQQVIIR